MNEAKEYRRAFAIGLLTLGVAMGGQMATSQPAGVPLSSIHRRKTPAASGTIRLFRAPPAAPKVETCLAQRVARAVIGAVLNGLA